jgi:hypothetical protein
MERVTDEEAGEGGWFWNEQVGSFRPPGALYCRECGVLIQGKMSCFVDIYLFFARDDDDENFAGRLLFLLFIYSLTHHGLLDADARSRTIP